jgi:hypothetical protein
MAVSCSPADLPHHSHTLPLNGNNEADDEPSSDKKIRHLPGLPCRANGVHREEEDTAFLVSPLHVMPSVLISVATER